MILIQNVKTTPMETYSKVPLYGAGETIVSETLVDSWAYPLISSARWRLGGRKFDPKHPTHASHLTAVIRSKGNCIVYLHRLLTNCPEGLVVDHINGDSLDNRLFNLRVCTPAQNSRNTKIRDGRLRGTRFFGKFNYFNATIRCDDKTYFLGCYKTELDAALAYDNAARILHGEYASLNYPNVPSKYSTIQEIRDGARRRGRMGQSGYRGVSRRSNGFEAYCKDKLTKKKKRIGLYPTPEEAYAAYLNHTRAA